MKNLLSLLMFVCALVSVSAEVTNPWPSGNSIWCRDKWQQIKTTKKQPGQADIVWLETWTYNHNGASEVATYNKKVDGVTTEAWSAAGPSAAPQTMTSGTYLTWQVYYTGSTLVDWKEEWNNFHYAAAKGPYETGWPINIKGQAAALEYWNRTVDMMPFASGDLYGGSGAQLSLGSIWGVWDMGNILCFKSDYSGPLFPDHPDFYCPDTGLSWVLNY